MPKLTVALIDNTAHPPAGQTFLRDSEHAGLGLRITKASKAFVFEKRIQGRMRRITLGRAGRISLEQARERVAQLNAQIASGVVPEQIRKRPTFGELADLYVERHLPRKRSGRNDRAVLRNHLASWRSRRLSEIKREDVVRMHAEIGKDAPYQANRLVALLRKMFNLARDWDLFAGENPADRIVFHPEEQRRRFLQPEELPRVFQALKEEPNEYARAAFVSAILSGARRQEILSMKWTELNLERGLWRIPQANGAPPHILPIPAQLVTLLKELPRMDGNPHVFVGEGASGHLVNVKRAWHRIRTKAEIADVRIQDLRRTFGAWLAGGESVSLVGQVLNHASATTTAAYAGLDLDPIREALERNARRILGGGKIGPAFGKPKATTTMANPLLALTAPELKTRKEG